jgi:ATP-dependent 26S proteasome regulatory subunit
MDKFVTFQSGDGQHRDAGKITLHDLLKGIDGVNQYGDGVIIMATTNYAKQLSEALINRPGRFDRIYKIELPKQKEIVKYLEYSEIDCKDRSLSSIADEFVGLNMAFVAEFVKTTKCRLKSKEFHYADVEDSIKKIKEHNRMAKTNFEKERVKVGFTAE